MTISILAKYAVSQLVGFIKGQNAIHNEFVTLTGHLQVAQQIGHRPHQPLRAAQFPKPLAPLGNIYSVTSGLRLSESLTGKTSWNRAPFLPSDNAESLPP
jgi:hypothetical protein